jgi:hypothetical protein
MLGRRRREERRFDQSATRYQMRQRMISIGDDYTIENDRGEHVFKLDGKALRVRKTILFKDMDGRELVKIQERMLHVRDSMEIEGADGNRIAMVHKAMITPLRERWVIDVEGGPDLHLRATLSSTSTPSSATGRRSPRCPSGGSGSGTPTGSRCPPVRTTS